MMRRQRGRIAWAPVALALLIACGDDGSGAAPGPAPVNNSSAANNSVAPPEGVTWLTPTQHLVRASMALRGLRPSPDEVEAVETDPAAIEGIVDRYLDDPAFGANIRDMYDEALLLRTFFFWFPPGGAYSRMELVEFNTSLSESPLRLIERVVMEDRPFSEIVTADYTLADGPVATVWGLDYTGDGATWEETRWPEAGRPHAGLLTDSKVWLRHYSTPLNAQRARANLVSRVFLCFDFLDNDINVDGNVDLSDPALVKASVKRPECASCHQSLDPIASLFWSFEFFTAPSQVATYPYSHYKPEYEQYRTYFTDRDPGFFGQPVADLPALGRSIAADPRFAQCAVRRFSAWFAQTELEEVPWEEVARLQRGFVADGMNARALARSIVLSDAFRTAYREGAPEDPAWAVKKVRPRAWSRMMEALIGFRWTADINFPLDFLSPRANYGTVDLMADPLFGYEVIAGGLDDFIVTQPVHTVNPTASLVFESFALEAAGFVVNRDLGSDAPEAQRLLTVGPEERAEPVIRQELSRLHRHLYAEQAAPDSAAIDDLWDLFAAALARSDDPRRAWKTTLTAMLQDGRLIYY